MQMRWNCSFFKNQLFLLFCHIHISSTRLLQADTQHTNLNLITKYKFCYYVLLQVHLLILVTLFLCMSQFYISWYPPFDLLQSLNMMYVCSEFCTHISELFLYMYVIQWALLTARCHAILIFVATSLVNCSSHYDCTKCHMWTLLCV
jgi:hypothetical protein